MKVCRDDIFLWLDAVKDPEIPVLSLPDLGIIKNIEIYDNGGARITITPTFVGCPALDLMKAEIIETLMAKGLPEVNVEVSYKEPWTSDDISQSGRKALAGFGLAPPPNSALFTDLDILEHVKCPRCEGQNTELRTIFGSTLCRSIHYCHDCRESFEQFKPV